MKTIIVEVPADWTPDTGDQLDAVTNALADAYVPALCYEPTQHEADLMTAAPDMLDALQQAREVLLWNLGDDARIDAAFDAVTAAINKATYTQRTTA